MRIELTFFFFAMRFCISLPSRCRRNSRKLLNFFVKSSAILLLSLRLCSQIEKLFILNSVEFCSKQFVVFAFITFTFQAVTLYLFRIAPRDRVPILFVAFKRLVGTGVDLVPEVDLLLFSLSF